MRKAISLFIACALLMITIGSVSANSGPKPVVTPLSGDQDFTVTYLNINQMPGSVLNSDGTPLPTGFASGEKQFEGWGAVVSGFRYGSASACFPISGISKGWGGQVGQWNGSKWVLLATTITTPAESEISYACATIYGDGTYALLSWIADASLLTNATTSSTCDFDISNLGNIMTDMTWEGDFFNASLIGIEFNSTGDLAGLPAAVSLLSASPTESYGVTGTGSGTISSSGEGSYLIWFASGLPMFNHTDVNSSYTYHIDFGDCYINYTVIPD
jgi:hypothetical protein